jgi:hypothetical protein
VDEVSRLMRAVLDTAMQIKASCCPSVQLRCKVLSVRDLKAGHTQPHGWRADVAWNSGLLSRKVRLCEGVVWCGGVFVRSRHGSRFLISHARHREPRARTLRVCSLSLLRPSSG